ncbi:MAG: xanthine dehydrogenase family protein [Acidimicrobiia bacterium]
MSERLTGARVLRAEDERLLTGRATFTADVQPAGALHAVFVRSPYPHARITAVDVSGAWAQPGVHAVLTHADLLSVLPPIRPPVFPELHAPEHTALASGTVRFVGDPVALVVATTLAQAHDAAEHVMVDYRPLAPVASAAAALAPDAAVLWPAIGTNVVHEQEHVVGDPDTALRDASVVVRTRIDQHRVAQAPMECRASVADFDAEAGTLTFTTAHQSPNQVRTLLGTVLGLDTGRIRVVCPFVGGSFGQKSGLAREDAALAAASILLGRPVRWQETRTENLLAAGHSREAYADVEIGFTAEGDLLGLRVHLVTDLGAYPQIGYPAAGYSNLVRALLPAAYRLDHFAFTATMVATNKSTYVPYRGPWEMETFLRERVLDLAARRLDVTPEALRARNLLTRDERERGSCLGVDLHGVTVDATLTHATELLEGEGWRAQVAAARAEGRLVGVGLSTYVEPAPVSPSLLRAMGVQAVARTTQEARLRLDADGGVTLFTSQQPHGQGHETTLAQLTSDVLALPMEQIRVVWGDTDLVPFNLVGTGGSRAAMLASGAVLDAADRLRTELLAPPPTGWRSHPRTWSCAGAVVPRRAVARHHVRRPRRRRTRGPRGGRRVPVGRRHVVAGHPPRDGGGRPRYGRRRHPALRGGGGLRPADQPDDRRRPGARGRRAGHRVGAARARRLRRRRPAPSGDPPRLPRALDHGDPGRRDPPPPRPQPRRRAGAVPRGGRGWCDRVTGGARERDRRRAGPARRRAHHAVPATGRAARPDPSRTVVTGRPRRVPCQDRRRTR